MAKRAKRERSNLQSKIAIKKQSYPLSRLALVHLPIPNPQDEVNNDSGEQGNGEDSRTESIIDTALSAPTDTLRPPVECH